MSIDSNYLKSYLFSFEGRARRLEYWMYHLFLMIVIVLFVVFSGLMAALVGGLEGESSADTSIMPALGAGIFGVMVIIVLSVVILWSSIAIQVKRWHDIDQSGWWVLINFVPFFGSICTLVVNGFFPGTEGKNRFGEDPLVKGTASNKEQITASEEAISDQTSSNNEEINTSEETSSDNDNESPGDKLTKLSKLKEKGLIDEDDYNSKKEEILKTI